MLIYLPTFYFLTKDYLYFCQVIWQVTVWQPLITTHMKNSYQTWKLLFDLKMAFLEVIHFVRCNMLNNTFQTKTNRKIIFWKSKTRMCHCQSWNSIIMTLSHELDIIIDLLRSRQIINKDAVSKMMETLKFDSRLIEDLSRYLHKDWFIKKPYYVLWSI